MTSETDFLKTYKAEDYPIVLVTVDTVLLTYHESELKVLLVKRANHPEKGKWGLPGGFLEQDQDKSLEYAAKRSVIAKTGVTPPYIEQLHTLGSKNRDPRGWSTSIVFSALMPYAASGDFINTVEGVAWVALNGLDELDLAFDHSDSIRIAVERYRQKALYSFIPVFALTQPFTVTDLRKVHEALIGHDIQRKSFIRRVEASGMLKDTGESRTERGRPATLYKTAKGIEGYRFVRNIESE